MDDHSPGNREARPPQGGEPRRFISLVEQIHRQAQQRRPRTDDQGPHEAPLVAVTRRLVWATWLLVIVGFLSVGAAILQWAALRSADEKAGRQASTMQGQLDEMQTEQRPWVYMTDIKAVTSLTWEEGAAERPPTGIKGPSLNISFAFKNSGKTPALNVSFWGRLVIVPFTFRPDDPIIWNDVEQDIVDMCNDAMKSVSHPERFRFGIYTFGRTVFPNDPSNVPSYVVSMNRGEFEKYKLRNGDKVKIDLLSCVDYADSANYLGHVTGTIFFLEKKGSGFLFESGSVTAKEDISFETDLLPGFVK